MKKLLFVFAVAAFTACGSGETKPEEKMDSAATAAKDTIEVKKDASMDSVNAAAKMMKDSVDAAASKMAMDTSKMKKH